MTAPETLAEARRADRISARSRELVELVETLNGVQRRVAQLVAGLRRDRVSWAQIGALLGVTKQAAQKRYDNHR